MAHIENTSSAPQQDSSPSSDSAGLSRAGENARRARWLVVWSGHAALLNGILAAAAAVLVETPALALPAILALVLIGVAGILLARRHSRRPLPRGMLLRWQLATSAVALVALGCWIYWVQSVHAGGLGGAGPPHLLWAAAGSLLLLVPLVHWHWAAAGFLAVAAAAWWWLLGAAVPPEGVIGFALLALLVVAGGRLSRWAARLVDAEAASRAVAIGLRQDLQHSERRVGIESDHRHAVEKELTLARDAAAEAMRAKTEFLATMSHEIRTPLNGILPILELLRDTPLNEEQRDYLDTAHKSSRHLLRLINDVLDFAKVESGKLELENIEVNLRELVESVADLMRRAAESKGLELTVNVDPEVPAAARGDPIRLRQVLTNLVSNAVKFTDRGSVRIEVRRQRLDSRHVELLFAVVDTGIGMSQETARRLFQSFTQADASTTRKHGGTGLGLVISKRLVELMGGRIGVRTTLGKGCTFWFLLPMRRSLHDVPSVRRDLRGVRALTLVKNPVECERIGQMLRSWHIREERAHNPMDALGKLRSTAVLGESWAFDVLIVDARGFEQGIPALVSELRSEPRFEALQMLLVVSPGSPLEHLRSDAGLSVVRTPLRREQFRTELRRLLDVADSPWAGPPWTLPDERAAWESALMAPEVAFGTNPRKARVLLVEDNPINLAVARRLLERLGMVCGVAKDGHDALLRLEREGPFDLVLMDVQMPGMDGYEATQRIRAREAGRARIPIVAMTANAMQGDRERCLEAGMDDYLPKPIDLATLRTTLVRWLKPETGEAGADNAPASRAPVSTEPTMVPAAAAAGDEAKAEESPSASEALRAEQAPESDAEKILDQSVLDELREIMEDDFVHLIRSYLEHAPSQIAQLEEAARAGDIEAMVRPAHSLKSSSANVGAIQVSQIAREIEGDARESRRTAAAAALPPLRDAFDRAAAALSALVAAATSGT